MVSIASAPSKNGNVERKLAALVGIGAAVILCGAALLTELALREQEAAGWVTHTVEVIAAAAAVKNDTEAAISEARAFMFDHAEETMSRRVVAVARTEHDLRSLIDLTRDNDGQNAAAIALEAPLMNRFAVCDEVAALIRAGRDAEVGPLLVRRTPSVQTSAIYQALDRLTDEERRLLKARSQTSLDTTHATIVAIFVAAIMLLFSFLQFTRALVRAQRTIFKQRLESYKVDNIKLDLLVKEKTEELQASEEKFRSYFENLSDGLIVAGFIMPGDYIVESVNEAARRILKILDKPCVEGSYLKELLPNDYFQHLLSNSHDVVDGRPVHFQCPLNDHEEVVLRFTTVTIAPTSSRQNDKSLLLICIHDETKRLQLEQQLHQSQKMEVIGNLAAGVAHDFNNILQIIQGCLEICLEQESLDVELREFTHTAQMAAERGAKMTQYMLSYAGKQVLRPELLDPGRLIRDMGRMIEKGLQPNTRIEYLDDTQDSRVLVDRSQLQTAVLNLAINAGHAMPKGGILTFETFPKSTDRVGEDCFIIAVSDNGCGMSGSVLARAREPFFTTKGVQGTGLGLSMVDGFAKQSGGSLGITSHPGHGTRMEISLPLHACSPCEGNASRSIPLGGSGRILLVDDLPDVLRVVGRILRGRGFDVLTVESGLKALTALERAEEFDLMITDFAMPGLSGIEVIRRARAIKPRLPVIIMTGYAEVDVDQTAGPITVLRKPVQQGDLLEAVLMATSHPGKVSPHIEQTSIAN